MRTTFALLLTLTLAASCVEQEELAPVEPATPNSGVQIVPGLSIGASGNAEVTPWSNPALGMRDTRATTRATSCPYVIADATGKKTIVVFKDKNGDINDGRVSGRRNFHPRWQETPDHNANTQSTPGVYPWGTLSSCLEVAQKNSGKMPWGATNAGCTAPWRRPTVGELEEIYPVSKNLELEEPFQYNGALYASATEGVSPSQGYHVRYDADKATAVPTAKSTELLVRCVRDAYPYVTTNAEGKMSVIVSQDEYGTSGAVLHTPWLQTPQHVHTNTEINSTSYRFEVAQDEVNNTWTSTNNNCQAPWRMPTHEELKTIFRLRDQLEVSTPLTLLSTYWSSSETSGRANYIHVLNFNPNSGVNGYTGDDATTNGRTNYTRCVRDVYDNFPDATGSNVATMWGYTATTGLVADNLIPPTAIKNTATGFELETARYYPVDGSKKLYFYAHAPHDGGVISNVDNATVTYDILGQTDVLWAKDDRGIAKNVVPSQQGQPFFQFQHKLMRLAFKVVADTSYPANKTVTKITAKNVNTKVAMTVPTGATTFSTPGDISIAPTTGHIITTTGTTLKEVMMTAPNSTVTLVVEAGGVTYPEITLPLTGEGAGTAGVSHLVILTFKQNLIVPSMVIIPWEGGDGGEGELI